MGACKSKKVVQEDSVPQPQREEVKEVEPISTVAPPSQNAKTEAAPPKKNPHPPLLVLSSFPKPSMSTSDNDKWLELELENVEWHVPERCQEETDMMTEIEALTNDQPAQIYDLTMKSLWKNWIDALELGLGRMKHFEITVEQQKLDLQFMTHKLDFTRIRQEVVTLCRKCIREKDFGTFEIEMQQFVVRCQDLASSQPEDLFSALPGIVPRRDTMMLQSRIEELVKKVNARSRPPAPILEP
jgi:hypothetical protein